VSLAMARRSSSRACAAMATAAVFALLAATATASGLVRVEHPAKSDGSLSLLVVGDWGRKGTYNQSRVAEQVKPNAPSSSVGRDPFPRFPGFNSSC
jgi:tartrate-resistant acid phosphatase type 5